jgi:hypothetical protein
MAQDMRSDIGTGRLDPQRASASLTSSVYHVHLADLLVPTVSDKVRKLMTVAGNKILRSVDLEKFCGFRFLKTFLS